MDQPSAATGRILVVDDQALLRRKLELAVRALGYEAVAAGSGEEALERCRGERFDLILLDILMPEMDGFEVLARLKADPRRRDIPVIVVSSLDDDMASVVRAIELGAEDFLPKAFDPVLLRARVTTCIEKKRLRDRDVEYIAQVERLTRAAELVEAGRYNPQKLALAEIARRNDSLGNLARVFLEMAQHIYERDRALRRRVSTLRGVLLLLGVGAFYGAVPALSRFLSFEDVGPLTMALLINGAGLLLMAGVGFARAGIPRLTPAILRFAAGAAALIVTSEVLLFSATRHLDASIVAMVLMSEALLGFFVAAAMGLEPASLRRFLGLGVGLVGLGLLVVGQGPLGIAGLWLIAAFAAACCYVAESMFIAMRRPADVESFSLMAVIMGFSALVTLPLAFALEDPLGVIVPGDTGKVIVTVAVLALFSGMGNVLWLILIQTAGAVFSGQSTYLVGFFGIAWGALLLGESLSAPAWVALALIVVGLIAVGPKQEAEAPVPAESGEEA